MICQVMKAPNDPTYFIRQGAMSTRYYWPALYVNLHPSRLWNCMCKTDECLADLLIGVLQSVASSIQSVCAASYHTMRSGPLWPYKLWIRSSPKSTACHHIFSPFDFPLYIKVSYVHTHTSQTWLLTPPELNLRLQCHNGLTPAPTITQ